MLLLFDFELRPFRSHDSTRSGRALKQRTLRLVGRLARATWLLLARAFRLRPNLAVGKFKLESLARTHGARRADDCARRIPEPEAASLEAEEAGFEGYAEVETRSY